MATLKIRRGTKAEISGITLDLSEFGYCTDTKEVYIGNGVGNTFVASEILDEDDLISNSSTSLATQQSIKAYVDNVIVGGDGEACSDLDGGEASTIYSVADIILDSGGA